VGTVAMTDPLSDAQRPDSPIEQEVEDDDDPEERGLTTLNLMHEELQ
jgi:hypothetical protein